MEATATVHEYDGDDEYRDGTDRPRAGIGQGPRTSSDRVASRGDFRWQGGPQRSGQLRCQNNEPCRRGESDRDGFGHQVHDRAQTKEAHDKSDDRDDDRQDCGRAKIGLRARFNPGSRKSTGNQQAGERHWTRL